MIPVTYSSHFQRPKSGNKIVSAGIFSSRIISFLLLALLALLYIAQSTQGATKEVELQRLRSESETISQESDQLTLDAERLRSLTELNKAAPGLQLEPAAIETYLTPKPTYQSTPN